MIEDAVAEVGRIRESAIRDAGRDGIRLDGEREDAQEEEERDAAGGAEPADEGDIRGEGEGDHEDHGDGGRDRRVVEPNHQVGGEEEGKGGEEERRPGDAHGRWG
ncbi:hypothetical protein L21_0602 [Methanoculleus chikugoensis]|uniref:Uncharacterized protein n=1 Tax=Methanoculleus chikugoensis TaxID=118126 RepID=A0A1M4MIG9_9EURY|nr:hypothetical protein [Methanoculleus chikugoensis]SCL74719.1 hypothetical protein L21_0602 [Methanoculleus chikugoensis]